MIQKLSTAIAIFIAIDIVIVLWTMLAIAQGVPTPHIPFWDVQIRALLSVMN